ncbi:MAG: type II toxin-antitoxin system VapC family toxin [Candidatus Micrarchaeia archaeon]
MDTCVLDAYLDSPNSSQESIKNAKRFIEKQSSKETTIICPAIARLELLKQLHKRYANKGKLKHRIIDSKLGELTHAGVTIKANISTNMEQQKLIFSTAGKNHAECKLGLGDSLIVADAQVNDAVLVTFDLRDFKKCFNANKTKYYDFKKERVLKVR